MLLLVSPFAFLCNKKEVTKGTRRKVWVPEDFLSIAVIFKESDKTPNVGTESDGFLRVFMCICSWAPRCV